MIVAIPPTLAGRIHYDPALPTVRDQLMQRMPQGTLMKAEAVYEQAVLARAGAQRHDREHARARPT